MKYAFSRLAFAAFVCLLSQAATAQSCTFKLAMHDGFGDGWTGGVLTIANGPSSQTFTLPNNTSDSIATFGVNEGDPLELNWTPGLFFNDEVSFELLNNDGDLLYQISAPPTGLLTTVTVNCISCLKPANIKTENVYDTRAKLRWSPASGISNPVGWRVVYGPKDFELGPGSGDSAYTATPKITLTGLQKKTWYDYYVQQDCGNGEFSALSGPFSFETYRSNDVGITALITPQSSCYLATETITVGLTNFGANPQSLIPFNYSVNGLPSGVPQPDDGFYTGVLGKDSTEAVEFEKTFNFSSPGEYRILLWTEMQGDEFTGNDTIVIRIVNRLTAPYHQNFEVWEGGWLVDASSENSSWAYGEPMGTQISEAAQGKKAWVTNLSGLYNLEERSYLRAPCFDFTDLTADPVIEFELNHEIEKSFDGAWLEISFDDGNAWQKVGAIGEGINWYNFNNTFNGLGDVWDGSSGGWVLARHRLNGAAGKAPVRLRFALGSDNFAPAEGIGIDDVKIYQPVDHDLSALAARSSTDGAECGSAADKVTLRFFNSGTKPQTLFNVAYSVNGGAPVVESVGNITVAPDEIFEYTFLAPFDSREGLYEVKCWTGLASEQNPENDTAIVVVDHRPLELPVQEDFENGFPQGWTSDGAVASDHGNVSNVLAYRMYVLASTYKTTLPNAGFIEAGDSLTFDYRITNFTSNGTIATTLAGNTRFEVQVSTNCGANYQTVYTINKDNHTPSVAMKNVGVSLTPFAGQAVRIRINGIWTNGNFYFDLDNVNLRAGTVSSAEIEGLRYAGLRPNPTSGTALLEAGFEHSVEARVTVLNALGAIVWQSETLQGDVLAQALDLQELPAGIYFVRLTVDGRSLVLRLIRG